MTREEMVADLVECWVTDLPVEHLEELAREALMERYRRNYSDADIAAEHAELTANVEA
jgi:hypothetical protein